MKPNPTPLTKGVMKQNKQEQCKYKKWQILEINWVDSMHGYKNWTHEDDLDFSDKYLYKKTVGMFIVETKEAITVVQSRDDDGEEKHNVDSVMTIPKVAIKKIKSLSQEKK